MTEIEEQQVLEKEQKRLRDARQQLRVLIDEGVARRSDVYYQYKVDDVARAAVSAFSKDRNRSQMKNLEQVSLSAMCFADVLDYVKSQAGRETNIGKLWRAQDFAETLHDTLWEVIRTDAEGQTKSIWKTLSKSNRKALERANMNKSDVERELRLRLCRAFIKHLVAHYTYTIATR